MQNNIAIAYTTGITLKELEREFIMAELKRHKYNRMRTAKTIGIAIRTLQRKLKEYGEPHSDKCRCPKCFI